MENLKTKKQNVDIIYEDATWQDETKLYVDKIVTFLDIKGYSLNGPYLVIQEKDDTQYVYPMDKISSLKLSVSE